ISNIGILKLGAENSIQLFNPGTMSVGGFDGTAGSNFSVQIGGSLLLNGEMKLNTLVLPGNTVATGADMTLNVTGDLTNNSATDFSRLRITNQGAHIMTGGNISVTIGGNLTLNGPASGTGEAEPGDFALVLQNTKGVIDQGGNITLKVNGDVSTKGQLTLLLQNWDFSANPAGHIGNGGNLLVTTQGNVTVDSIAALLNNRAGGMIDSAASITFNIAGALTTLNNGTDNFGDTESVSIFLSNRYDDSQGSTTSPSIGGAATVSLHAESAAIN